MPPVVRRHLLFKILLQSIIIPYGGEGINDTAIGDGKRAMRRVAGNYVYSTCSEYHFFSANDHFQFPFQYMRYLFMRVLVLGQMVTFLYVYKG